MKLACLGSGKMGTALLQGIVARGVCTAADIVISDPIAAAVAAARTAVPGVNVAESNTEAVRGADAVLLCVKPYGIVPLVESLREPPSTLLISIAAGVTLPQMEAAAGGHRVVRVMPNTPALVGKGAAAYAPGSKATEADCSLTEKLLSAVGTVTRVPERLLDAVTGLSGSGPAYIYTVIEALADGGVAEGLTKEQALQLAAQTVAGAAEMVLQTGLHPAVLRDQVTSPGGTTIAALATLEAKGLRSALIEAVRTATRRAQELGRS
ncbi:MAG TPA: pyrroline-5-carboxylate reductase [Verrucomicrobiales bacterium]|nr:pyrroline-5-carboxylate reductase [Verrucomicrobiales bacterium]